MSYKTELDGSLFEGSTEGTDDMSSIDPLLIENIKNDLNNKLLEDPSFIDRLISDDGGNHIVMAGIVDGLDTNLISNVSNYLANLYKFAAVSIHDMVKTVKHFTGFTDLLTQLLHMFFKNQLVDVKLTSNSNQTNVNGGAIYGGDIKASVLNFKDTMVLMISSCIKHTNSDLGDVSSTKTSTGVFINELTKIPQCWSIIMKHATSKPDIPGDVIPMIDELSQLLTGKPYHVSGGGDLSSTSEYGRTNLSGNFGSGKGSSSGLVRHYNVNNAYSIIKIILGIVLNWLSMLAGYLCATYVTSPVLTNIGTALMSVCSTLFPALFIIALVYIFYKMYTYNSVLNDTTTFNGDNSLVCTTDPFEQTLAQTFMTTINDVHFVASEEIEGSHNYLNEYGYNTGFIKIWEEMFAKLPPSAPQENDIIQLVYSGPDPFTKFNQSQDNIPCALNKYLHKQLIALTNLLDSVCVYNDDYYATEIIYNKIDYYITRCNLGETISFSTKDGGRQSIKPPSAYTTRLLKMQTHIREERMYNQFLILREMARQNAPEKYYKDILDNVVNSEMPPTPFGESKRWVDVKPEDVNALKFRITSFVDSLLKGKIGEAVGSKFKVTLTNIVDWYLIDAVDMLDRRVSQEHHMASLKDVYLNYLTKPEYKDYFKGMSFSGQQLDQPLGLRVQQNFKVSEIRNPNTGSTQAPLYMNQGAMGHRQGDMGYRRGGKIRDNTKDVGVSKQTLGVAVIIGVVCGVISGI